MNKYLVELDQKFAVIKDNRAKVAEGYHGVIKGGDEEYAYRSRHPLIVAWVVDNIKALNKARYALVSAKSEPLRTQLVNHRLGQVFTVEATYKSLTEEELSLIHAERITLTALIEQAPRLHVEPKRYPVVVSLRLTTPQLDLIRSVGDGNANKGARRLIDRAIEDKLAIGDCEIPKDKHHFFTMRLTETQAHYLNTAGAEEDNTGNPSRGAHRLFEWTIKQSPPSNLPSEKKEETHG